MTEAGKSVTSPRPKGGRKGGTLFPKISLQQSLVYATRLVAKTHTGAQPATTILPGVFDSASDAGKVRASALKQFGLLEGTADAYQSSSLARGIEGALPEERLPLLQRAFRSSKLFNDIFETFHGDTVSKAKIEQRAKGLEVHPDSAAQCAQLFIESAVIAGLGTADGDSIMLVCAKDASNPAPPDHIPLPEEKDTQHETGAKGETTPDMTSGMAGGDQASSQGSRPAKAALNVTLNVDSSSDPDKLEKQLKLLRTFGVI